MNPNDMSENWILVWFAGADGWENWDSPWVVYLQRKPKSMNLNENGLHFEFNDSAGYVALLPLYGYYKPPQKGKRSLTTYGLPSKGIATWEWSSGISKTALERVRYWSKVSREFPIYCEDSFSVDRSKDTITIRQRFDWISIDDDWKTPHIKLAPISPPLGQVSMDKDFPMKFSHPIKDVDMFTPYGPYMGIEGVDSYDVEFYVLQYINETEAYDIPNVDVHPTVKMALEKLRETSRNKFKKPG